MIRSLFIKNFALIEEAHIRFTPGLNIITGETGAGKSIVVNAIAQLCGERSSVELVRKGAPKAILEAELDLTPRAEILKILKELLLEEPQIDSGLIIRKEISARGVSRTFVNDTPVPLNKLNELSSYLIDLHGQHQHQRLLHPENHLEYLDAFGGLHEHVQQFATLLTEFKDKVKERDQLRTRRLEISQKQDMFRFQMEELRKAQLDPDELDTLYAELKRLNNIENIHQLATAIDGFLYSGEPNASGLIAQAEDNLQQLSEFDAQFNEFEESLANARESVEEIGRFINEYLADLEFDPDRLQFVQERIGHLEFLLKKYQKSTIQELVDYLQEIESFSADFEQFDERILAIEQELDGLAEKIQKAGYALSEKRKAVAQTFEKNITRILNQIGMPHARFRVAFSVKKAAQSPFVLNGQPLEANDRGFDLVMFELASNAGEDFKPLHKIASGGEISRIMLALKASLASTDQVPSMVFDEIDSGISGKIAQIVGVQMAKLSKNQQILCVTHLPQIAAFAHSHFKVTKNTEDNRTYVDIKQLNDEERVEEIASLLGGQTIAEETLQNARHLIEEAQTFTGQ